MKLPKELEQQRKGLINTQNTKYNEWFKWCLIRYLNLEDRNLGVIIKFFKGFAKELNVNEIKLQVKRRDSQKNEKKCHWWQFCHLWKKVKYPIYVSQKCCDDKYAYLQLIGEGVKNHFGFIKNSNAFMYDYILYRGRKYFCCYYLEAFRTVQKLKCHIKDCF